MADPANETPPAAPQADDGPVTVRDRRIAEHVAVRAVVLAEWTGALLLLASFAQLYFLVIARLGSGALALGLGLTLLVIGGTIQLRARRSYRGMETTQLRRWHAVAGIVGGAGAMFWLLFGFLMLLTVLGVPVLPE